MAQNRQRGSYDREYTGVIRRVRLVTALILLVLLAFRFAVGIGIMRDDAMSPACPKGSFLLFLRLGRDCKRGDVVLARLEDGGVCVRRVLAVGGDTVEIRSGILYINGLAERGTYSFTRTDPAENGPDYPVLLRQGELFLLGDNREASVDSRSFGVIESGQIVGRVLN